MSLRATRGLKAAADRATATATIPRLSEERPSRSTPLLQVLATAQLCPHLHRLVLPSLCLR